MTDEELELGEPDSIKDNAISPINMKEQLRWAFNAARISECAVFESNSVRTSGASKFLGLKYKSFDDWYKTRGEKL